MTGIAKPPLLIGASARAGGMVSVFPTVDDDSNGISQAELKSFSRHYSALYVSLIDRVSASLVRGLGLHAGAASVLAREALVTPAHFFLDRLIRLSRFAQSRRGDALAVCSPAPAPSESATVESLRSRAHSDTALNEAMLARLAPLIGLPTVPAPGYAAPAAAAGPTANRNFETATLGQRLRRKVMDTLHGALKRRGRIPTLSMAYAQDPLRMAGFYRGELECVLGRASWMPAAKDPELRRRAVAEPVESCLAVDEFAASIGLRLEPGALRRELAAYLSETFPTDYLEAARVAQDAALSVLRPYAPAPLLVGEPNYTEATHLIAAAKSLGMKVIGWQHGGHFGYIEDHTLAVELEYPFYDLFLTWGWCRMPDFEVCRSIPTRPLPNPWLAERRAYWSRALPPARRTAGGKRHDILLMSNKVYPFPPAPSGAAVCRGDRAKEYGRLLVDFVSAARSRGYSVLHKPYNQSTASLMSETFETMRRIGADAYATVPLGQKGLAPEVVSECAIVVWDQPGTGLLECLASGLPTLGWWPRLYNEEEPRRRGLMESLERVGVLHATAASLIEEYGRFRSSPERWMSDERRVAAVDAFCRELAWAEPGWPRAWAEFLRDAARWNGALSSL